MRLEPGAMRDCTGTPRGRVGVRDRGAGPDDGHRPARNAETNDFGRGPCGTSPAATPHARMPGGQAGALHPDLRQRLLLGVRHVQHHRLDRPHPKPRCEELRRPRVGLRRVPDGRGVLRRGACRRRSSRSTPGRRLPRRRTSSSSSTAPHALYKGAGSGGSIPPGSRISKTSRA